jgi:hypothetical protein
LETIDEHFKERLYSKPRHYTKNGFTLRCFGYYKTKQSKWYGCVLKMEDKRFPKDVLEWMHPERKMKGIQNAVTEEEVEEG